MLGEGVNLLGGLFVAVIEEGICEALEGLFDLAENAGLLTGRRHARMLLRLCNAFGNPEQKRGFLMSD